ncbi:MAG: Farnesyl diphosphate synthase [Steroidobacteraceae bacterium]|nr:Farnesyl diphosphate synthase [Steroidobacteraceae bacterium]
MNDTAFEARVAGWRTRFERVLDQALALPDAATARLRDAMRYSALGGGKRLRPLLVYATGSAFGAPPDRLDAPATAVEMIHVYSLIHDDLPAMDDDDLRRGRPTCHRAFDEPTALLAGDALQAHAFEVLSRPATGAADASVPLAMIRVLAEAIGTSGMAGGQAIDLESIGCALDLPAVENMHRRKTGALIRASVLLGAIAAGVCAGARYEALARYGAEIGLAFQIQDDILDVEGSTEQIGKTSGADAVRDKPTYPSRVGLAEAHRLALAAHDRALAALATLGEATATLESLAHYVVRRER